MTASVSSLEPRVPATQPGRRQAKCSLRWTRIRAPASAWRKSCAVVRQPVCQQDALFPDDVGRDHRCGIRGRAAVYRQRGLGVDHRPGAEHRHQSALRDARLREPGGPGQTVRGAEPDPGGLSGHQQPRAAVERHRAAVQRQRRHRGAGGRQERLDHRHDAGLLRLAGFAATSGSLFDEGQSRAGAPVAVLGATWPKTVRQRYGGRPDGARQGSDAPGDRRAGRQGRRGHDSVDDQLFAPISFVQQRLFGRARRTATATGWQTSSSRRATATTSKPSRIGSRSCSASAII